MKYIIKSHFENIPDMYLYRDFPHITWTDDVTLALRMQPKRAAKISYSLMNIGVSHCIIQIKDI